MLQGIFTFLGTAATAFFGFLGDLLGGPIAIIWNGTTLEPFGELLLIGSVVGVGMFALRWILSLIPFASKR
jgi:hypothetical protein